MAQVNITFYGRSIMVLCNKNDTMRNIFQKFAIKANINLNSIYFVYSGNYIVNKDLTFDQLSNNEDRIRNAMNILAIDYNKSYLMNSNKISSSPAQFIYPDESNPAYQIYEAIPTFESQSPYQAMPAFQTNPIYQTNQIPLSKLAYQSSPMPIKKSLQSSSRNSNISSNSNRTKIPSKSNVKNKFFISKNSYISNESDKSKISN